MALIDIDSNSLAAIPPEQQAQATTMMLNQMVDQLNGAPQVYPVLSPGQQQPVGLKAGDVTVGFNGENNPQVAIYNGAVALPISSNQTQSDMGFGGLQAANGLPGTNNFSDNTWGFYTDTSSGFNYIAYNQGGTIFKQQLT